MEGPGLMTRTFFLFVQVSLGIAYLRLPSVSGYFHLFIGMDLG
jgi:hypothetical protein